MRVRVVSETRHGTSRQVSAAPDPGGLPRSSVPRPRHVVLVAEATRFVRLPARDHDAIVGRVHKTVWRVSSESAVDRCHSTLPHPSPKASHQGCGSGATHRNAECLGPAARRSSRVSPTPDSVDTEQVGGPADDFLVAHLQLDAGVMVLAGRSDAEPSFSFEKPCKPVLIAWTVPSHELGGKGSLRRLDRRLAWGHLRAGQRAIDLRPPCAEIWPQDTHPADGGCALTVTMNTVRWPCTRPPSALTTLRSSRPAARRTTS